MKLSGFKGYVTNIPVQTMPAAEVIGTYHDLWHVEAVFPDVEDRSEGPPDLSPEKGRD